MKMARLKPMSNRRKSKVVGEPGVVNLWVFGAYVKGGLHGITRPSKDHPMLTRMLAKYMLTRIPLHRWSSLKMLLSSRIGTQMMEGMLQRLSA